MMEMLKGNFLVPTGKAYANDGKTNGFAFDVMDRKGLKTLEMIDKERQQRGKYGNIVNKINIFKKNQAQNARDSWRRRSATARPDVLWRDGQLRNRTHGEAECLDRRGRAQRTAQTRDPGMRRAVFNMSRRASSATGGTSASVRARCW